MRSNEAGPSLATREPASTVGFPGRPCDAVLKCKINNCHTHLHPVGAGTTLVVEDVPVRLSETNVSTH